MPPTRDLVPTVAAEEDAPHRDRRRTGQPLPPNWRELFLESYAEFGTYWRACKDAGVSDMTVTRHRQHDPDFATQVEAARQEFADSQEEQLATLGRNGNVVGPIVLLKKHRPAEYIERNLTVTANFTANLDAAAGQQLLTALLGQMHDLRALKPAAPDTP